MGDFINRLIFNEGTKSFSDKIKESVENVHGSFVKAKVSKNGKQQEIQVQSNILAKLVHLSLFTKSAINLEKAMCFPLAPVSLPLSHYDGTICRRTISIFSWSCSWNTTSRKKFWFFRWLAQKILGSIPNQYNTVYIVCDTYKISSIKYGERMLCGDFKVYILETPDRKLPFDMTTFPQNGKNKALLFNLIERSIVEDKNKLNERVVFFSNKERCLSISIDQVLKILEKASDHQEAGTKLVAPVESVEVKWYRYTSFIYFPSVWREKCIHRQWSWEKSKDNLYLNGDAIFTAVTCVSWGLCIFGKWLHFQLFLERREKDVEPCVKKWMISSGIFGIRTVQQYHWWCNLNTWRICVLFVWRSGD